MGRVSSRKEFEIGSELEDRELFGQAVEWYTKAAKRGNMFAQNNLGNLYDDGKGCEKNPAMAVFWYKQAVKSGCAEAAGNLGVHYRQLGKKRWARYWFERAVAMGDEEAEEEIRNL